MPHTPAISVARTAAGVTLTASGRWNVHTLSQDMSRDQIRALRAAMAEHARTPNLSWNLTGIEAMDHVGAMMFRRACGGKRPARLAINPAHEVFFVNLDKSDALAVSVKPITWRTPLEAIGTRAFQFADHLAGFVRLLGQIVLDFGRFARAPLAGPWREICANLFRSGAQALGITALVGVFDWHRAVVFIGAAVAAVWRRRVHR